MHLTYQALLPSVGGLRVLYFPTFSLRSLPSLTWWLGNRIDIASTALLDLLKTSRNTPLHLKHLLLDGPFVFCICCLSFCGAGSLRAYVYLQARSHVDPTPLPLHYLSAGNLISDDELAELKKCPHVLDFEKRNLEA